MPACEFYRSLKKKILSTALVLDIFAFCSEETGLAEMSDLIIMTGGLLVLGEEFNDQQGIF